MKKILIAVASRGLASRRQCNAAVDAAKAKQLAQKYNCLACHAEDKKLVARPTRKSPRSTRATPAPKPS